MPTPKTYLPMLSGLMLGEAMSSHNGVRCYPAIRHSNEEKYIVKIISIPASQVQLDALLLTGAFPSREAALEYYMDVSRDVLRETEILRQLSQQEGFIPYLDAQIVSTDDLSGYEVYLLSGFHRSLEQIFQSETLTHQGIASMALDLCAALAACRRAGYIYVDLKPSNIFHSSDQGYRIGDVGFASLASLPYSSLPEKYRSRYTAPELLDEMAVLNGTADVYALGLVLYQAYNGGTLPQVAPGQELPAPLYADYEFKDIILKACHPDASKRWKNPTALAKAIIAYLQKNPVSDTSIIPSLPEEIPEEPVEVEEFLPEADSEELRREMEALEGTEYEELAFMASLRHDETDAPADLSDLPLSQEISEMLAQADELIAHTLPDPAVAPPPIDVPMPERITLEEETEESTPAEPEDTPAEPEPVALPEDPLPPAEKEPKPQALPQIPRRPFPWKVLVTITIIIVLLSTAFTGLFYYQNEYLQEIESLILEGHGDMLSVKVVSSVDHSLLTVVCSDSYGNTQRQRITAGIAVFTELNPQTYYQVWVEISGFHKLTGHCSDSFTTAAQTQITQLNAGIGNEDGSVVIQFTTAGPAVQNWIITYSAPDVPERVIGFQGNIVPIYDLVIGKEYTFNLSREDGQALAGQTQVQYIASPILLPEDLQIISCGNGTLTAQWRVPAGASDVIWNVRCYNASGYSQTITTTEPFATFTGLTHEAACTVEVTAKGMPRGESVTIAANPVTVEQIRWNQTDDGMLSVSWEYYGDPTEGWMLEYSINGLDQQPITLTESTASLPLIPGASYTLSITAPGCETQFGGTSDYTCPDAQPFQGWGLDATMLQSALCVRPESSIWTVQDISPEQYTDHFAPDQSLGLLLLTDAPVESSDDSIRIRFVVRDAAGNLLYFSDINAVWNSLWTVGGCALNIDQSPQDSGEYHLTVYFNGQYVTELTFFLEDAQ